MPESSLHIALHIALKTLSALLLCVGTPDASIALPERLDGRWIATSIVSTGVIGERYWERVSPLLGNSVVIQGQNVSISQGDSCELVAPVLETWTNDMRTFGSFGGDWSQLGLQMSVSQGFDVFIWRVDCPEPDWPKLSIVTQSNDGVLLLGSHRVFVVLRTDDE